MHTVEGGSVITPTRRRGALALVIAILSLTLVFGPGTPQAQALVAAPIVPAAIAAGGISGGTGAAITGGAVAGGAVVCTGTVVCALAVLAVVAVVGVSTYLIYDYFNKDNSDVPTLTVGGASVVDGFQWNKPPALVRDNGVMKLDLDFTIAPEYRQTSGTLNNYYAFVRRFNFATGQREAWGIINGGGTSVGARDFDYDGRIQGLYQFSSGGGLSSTSIDFDPSIHSLSVAISGSPYLPINKASTNVYENYRDKYEINSVLVYGVQDFVDVDAPAYQAPQYPADPFRAIVVSGTCRAADGSSFAATPFFSNPFRHSGDLPPLQNPICPPGSTLTSMTAIEWVQNNAGQWVPKSDPLFYTQLSQETIIEYEDCLTGGVVCEVTPSPTNPDACTFGPYELVEGCSPAVEVVTEAPPATSPLPFNPTPIPAPTAPPVLVPPAEPIPNLPAPGVASPTECAPSGFEILNPLAYVTGTACVLTWAFVPSSPQAAVSQISDAFNDTALGTVTGAFGQLAAPFIDFSDADASSGCLGPNVVIPFALGDDLDIYPFAACESPAKEASEIVRTISTITFYVSGIFLVTSIVLSAFGITLGGFLSSRGDS